MKYFKNISNVEILDDLGICADVEYKDGQYLAFCDEDGNIMFFDHDDYIPTPDIADIDVSAEARNELAEFFAREKSVFALKEINKIKWHEEHDDAYYYDWFDKTLNTMNNGVTV